MKYYAKLIVGILIVTLVVVLSALGALYAANWFFKAIGMSVATATKIIMLYLNAGCGLMMALATCGSLCFCLSMWWKKCKREKQEKATMKERGGDPYE